MSRRRYRTKKFRTPPPRIVAGGLCALLVPFAALLWAAERPAQSRAPSAAVAPATVQPARAAHSAAPGWPVYRYSVVPGGVHSAAELAAVVARDPVVAAHYAGFDIANARLVRVDKARYVRVSYRIGDQIYWTKKKLLLAAGEYVLTDGKHLIRARCGNRIDDDPQAPVLDDEPAPGVLDQASTPAGAPLDPATAASMAAMEPGQGGAGDPPLAGVGGQPHARPHGTDDGPVLPRPWTPPGTTGQPAPTPQVHKLLGETTSSGPKPPGSTPGGQDTPPTELPEPGTAPLAGLALAMLALVRRGTRRRPLG